MRKALSHDFVMFGIFLLVIIFGLAIVWDLFRYSSDQDVIGRGQAAISDANLALHGVKQSFEKTAILFGLMNAAKELGAHGGVSDPNSIIGETPSMKTDSNILYFAPIESGSIKKRMPFVYYNDYGLKIPPAPYTAPIILPADSAWPYYGENIADVVNGIYSFHVLAQVIMLKPGDVYFKVCQEDRCTPEKHITESSAVIVDAGNSIVTQNDEEITFSIRSSRENIAVLRQLSVSIYDKNVVSNPSQLFNKTINNYWIKVAGSEVIVNPYDGYFVSAGTGIYNTLAKRDGFLKGIVLAPNKAKVKHSSEDVTAQFDSWSFAEEDLQVRYWLMYRSSEYFVDILNQDGLIMPRLLEGTETLDDYCSGYASDIISTGTDSTCASAYDLISSPTFNCVTEPSHDEDAIHRITSGECDEASADDFRGALNIGLQKLAAAMNTTYRDQGLSWRISIPGNLLTSADFKSITFGDSNVFTVLSCACRNGFNGICFRYGLGYNCYSNFAREYTSNGHNLKILVEITDEKYTLFDSTAKTWVKPVFKFFAEYYPVDDDYCNGYQCSSMSSAATLPVPADLPTAPFY